MIPSNDLPPEWFPGIAIDRQPRRVTSEEALALMSIFTDTAAGLVADARLLLDYRRRERAAGLAILALEELGKIRLVVALLDADERSLVVAWRNLFKHASKHIQILSPPDAVIPPEDRRLSAEVKQRIAANLSTVKQLALYSNPVVGKGWQTPRQALDAFSRRGRGIPEFIQATAAMVKFTRAWLDESPDPIGAVRRDMRDEGEGLASE